MIVGGTESLLSLQSAFMHYFAFEDVLAQRPLLSVSLAASGDISELKTDSGAESDGG